MLICHKCNDELKQGDALCVPCSQLIRDKYKEENKHLRAVIEIIRAYAKSSRYRRGAFAQFVLRQLATVKATEQAK